MRDLICNTGKGGIIKAWLRSKTADKVLSPLREEIICFIENGSYVLDVGCGTGDLLFRAIDKIKFGLGVDLDSNMIQYANKKKKKLKADNLEFIQEDINSLKHLSSYDINVASSTLCLHEMEEGEAISALKSLSSISSRILIADYSKPKSFWSRITIEVDEMISGHYGRFREYRKKGYVPYLARMAGLKVNDLKETPIDGILIWELHSENYA